jgi:pyruvate,orthophosphate dikinase
MAGQAMRWILRLDGSALPEKALIGGKAWSVAHMRALGLSVPAAFVITTEACRHYLEKGGLPEDLDAELEANIAWLEAQSGRRFGAGPSPLLVSVRSGAPISMPGMMDTVLNLGINDETQGLLAAECGDPAFAADTRRRFRELYATIVLKTEDHDAAAIPENVRDQLKGAINAVFDSWNSRRARRYRDHHGIAHTLGTAVTVQAMVFGNMDAHSGTGVLFSRNPITGEAVPYGEFLARAQGEDVVSGKHTPKPLSAMREVLGHAMDELLEASTLLEKTAADIQDIEFTVERGKLYLLQSRVAKRAPQAALRSAVDMVQEGWLEPAAALQRISSEQVRLLLSPRLAEGAAENAIVIARGEAASPGVGVGTVVADSDAAEARAAEGERVVLARPTTSPNDLHGMIAAKAILTEQGGSTSHAAVVGRALGRPCVVGCGADSLVGLAGKTVTVDGGTGTVYEGALPVVTPREEDDPALRLIAQWAAAHAKVTVVATPPAGARPVDFDENLEQSATLFATLAPGAAVSGARFANDEKAVLAAIEAGATTIITQPVLPALLAAAHAALANRG